MSINAAKGLNDVFIVINWGIQSQINIMLTNKNSRYRVIKLENYHHSERKGLLNFLNCLRFPWRLCMPTQSLTTADKVELLQVRICSYIGKDQISTQTFHWVTYSGSCSRRWSVVPLPVSICQLVRWQCVCVCDKYGNMVNAHKWILRDNVIHVYRVSSSIETKK